jgi:hypothetical protein
MDHVARPNAQPESAPDLTRTPPTLLSTAIDIIDIKRLSEHGGHMLYFGTRPEPVCGCVDWVVDPGAVGRFAVANMKLTRGDLSQNGISGRATAPA